MKAQTILPLSGSTPSSGICAIPCSTGSMNICRTIPGSQRVLPRIPPHSSNPTLTAGPESARLRRSGYVNCGTSATPSASPSSSNNGAGAHQKRGAIRWTEGSGWSIRGLRAGAISNSTLQAAGAPVGDEKKPMDVGPWVQEKLGCLRKYLQAYTTILSKRKFEGYFYIDKSHYVPSANRSNRCSR